MKHLANWRLAVKLILTLFLACLCNLCPAQDTAKKTTMPLQELTGFSQAYYYSAGQEKRAHDIAEFMEGAVQYFQGETGFTPKTKMYILSPQNWKEFAAPALENVYGFPHNIDHVRLAIAAEDNDFWKGYLPAVNQLPSNIAIQVTRAYRKPDSTYSMMPFFDLLALHELGHSYTSQAGLKMHRNWMGELFVNIMLHTYIAEKQPALLNALTAFPNMVIAGGVSAYKYTSLQDFEKLYATMGMGPQNYGWYQCRLHAAAKDIYNAGGKKVLLQLWKALKKHQEIMTDEAFVRMLTDEVHPAVARVFLDWDK
ncbi:MAG: hypothetical protein EOO13_12730 [Chitinophagaceae bacterium]|nr:MAG: hypothetical protein EOO13_12730 [Chitinophagaceae bacterium]